MQPALFSRLINKIVCFLFRAGKIFLSGCKTMKCAKCGRDINSTNHFYVPVKNRKEGLRYCISCAREEKIVTLV